MFIDCVFSFCALYYNRCTLHCRFNGNYGKGTKENQKPVLAASKDSSLHTNEELR